MVSTNKSFFTILIVGGAGCSMATLAIAFKIVSIVKSDAELLFEHVDENIQTPYRYVSIFILYICVLHNHVKQKW